MDTEMLVYQGGAVKRLDEYKFGADLVCFTSKNSPDLSGDFFLDSTDYDFEDGDRRSLYYDHGFNEDLGNAKIGRFTLKMKPGSVWMEGEVDKRIQYADQIMKMIQDGDLSVSSGALSHLVRRRAVTKSTFEVTHWPIGEGSLTPTPAEPRTVAVPIKSWLKSESRFLKGDALGKYADDAMGADMAVAGIHSLNSSLASHVMRHAYGYDGEPKTPDEKVSAIHAGVREHGRTARKMISACLGGDKDEAKAILERAFREDFTTDDEAAETQVKAAFSIATIRDFEDFLRDAGYSKKDATAVALHGFNSRRDAGEDEPITPETETPPLIDAKAQQPDSLKLTLLNSRMESLMRAFA